ncbi:MAG: pyruvate ferredoxin oxidoreductase, partial [Candidatus Diapherotrites archaeon CG09_land_8_20_14_0_10_32_12]
MRTLINGNYAVSYAMMQINPDVCASYPITPQTQIIEIFSKYVADGKVTTENILVESEHSAMSACIGASAAGARVFTATASQGLAYMIEVIYIAAGLRLPMTMVVGNRGIGAPLLLHCDYSDSFLARDSGWVQIYCKDVQEVYDTTLMAVKITEDIKIPVMVMMDGFYTTHGEQVIDTLSTKQAKDFVGKKLKWANMLDSKISFGNVALMDSNIEVRERQWKDLAESSKSILKIQKGFEKISKRGYGLYESFGLKDANTVFVSMGSSYQAIELACQELRKNGKKVGCLRPRVYRPFPYTELRAELKGKKV